MDKVFNSPGNWDLLYCPQCKLAWLNPQPVPEELHKVYDFYYTHQDSKIRRLLSPQNPIRAYILARYYGYDTQRIGSKPGLLIKTISSLPFFREIIGMGILHLPTDQKGVLLDIGCGSGQFLSVMSNLGWEVKGIEIDERAAAIARDEYGLDVFIGGLEEAHYPDKTFDVITLNHVLEHLYDPIELLSECHRILKPKGKLILTTPNIESLGHKLFREDWRGLEIPRHLLIFSLSSIEKCTQKAGFQTLLLRGSARITRDIFLESQINRKKRRAKESPERLYKVFSTEGWFFQLLVETARPYFRSIPDEIFYVGERLEIY